MPFEPWRLRILRIASVVMIVCGVLLFAVTGVRWSHTRPGPVAPVPVLATVTDCHAVTSSEATGVGVRVECTTGSGGLAYLDVFGGDPAALDGQQLPVSLAPLVSAAPKRWFSLVEATFMVTFGSYLLYRNRPRRLMTTDHGWPPVM
jgi:hypothetical protein